MLVSAILILALLVVSTTAYAVDSQNCDIFCQIWNFFFGTDLNITAQATSAPGCIWSPDPTTWMPDTIGCNNYCAVQFGMPFGYTGGDVFSGNSHYCICFDNTAVACTNLCTALNLSSSGNCYYATGGGPSVYR